MQAVIRMNIEQVPKPCDADADPVLTWGRLSWRMKRAKEAVRQSAGALVTACKQRSSVATREVPRSAARSHGPNLLPARVGQDYVG